jgi:hypothetical protein|tara:strand:+ start:351 stop:860 length:510 start_codon:yes stop_codon:yes gene_type:complete
MSDAIKLQMAIDQIAAARAYTMTLLEDIDHDQWFHQANPTPSHIAWQVGHLAMAQYGLLLFRQRGRSLDDSKLMSSSFRKKFSRGTAVSSDAGFYPSVDDILNVFHAIYDQSMSELANYPLDQLNDPVDDPYAAYPTKLGCLLFSVHHEMLHAGQIGLLRRLLSKDPIR